MGWIWGGGLVLLGLGGTAHSLMTYRGAELRTYLVIYALVLAGCMIAALNAWFQQRRAKRD